MRRISPQRALIRNGVPTFHIVRLAPIGEAYDRNAKEKGGKRSLRATCVLARRLEVPRKQVVEAALGVSACDGGHRGLEIGKGFDAVDFTGFDQ